MMDINKVSHLIISADFTLIQAMQRMDETDVKLLFIMDGQKFVSLVSIGDIQRAIIKNVSLQERVIHITRKNIRVGLQGQDMSELRQIMIEFRMVAMPVLDKENTLTEVLFWKDLFDNKVPAKHDNLDLPVVIMAGGLGSRLLPITNVIPKPLIPLGSKTMLEHIIDNFMEIGCNKFHLSVNYKADFIKFYFDQLQYKNYSIQYIQEHTPLGTAGSLSLLKDTISTTFFVSNCDIIIEQDLSEIYQYHVDHKNELTAVAVIKHYKIPYGTFTTREDGRLEHMNEKPEFTLKINSGIYILEPHLLKEIPENKFFHITELMESLCKQNRPVGVFPVSENSWKDIGTWTEYIKASNLNF